MSKLDPTGQIINELQVSSLNFLATNNVCELPINGPPKIRTDRCTTATSNHAKMIYICSDKSIFLPIICTK